MQPEFEVSVCGNMGRVRVSSQLHRDGGNLHAGMRGMFEGDLEAGTMHM